MRDISILSARERTYRDVVKRSLQSDTEVAQVTDLPDGILVELKSGDSFIALIIDYHSKHLGNVEAE